MSTQELLELARQHLGTAVTCVGRFSDHELHALVARQAGARLAVTGVVAAHTRRVRALLADGQPRMVFQPIFELATGRVAAVEALARFDTAVSPAPLRDWFHAAHTAGIGAELEAVTLRRAFEALPSVPEGVRLSVNVSAKALCGRPVHDVLAEVDLSRVTLELTEHEQDIDLSAVTAVLSMLRDRGARIALDDLGAGYAGLHRLLELNVSVLKIDRKVVGNIASDPARRHLIQSLVAFACGQGLDVVAEGVQSVADLHALVGVGVGYAQGFLLAEPTSDPVAALKPVLAPARQPAS